MVGIPLSGWRIVILVTGGVAVVTLLATVSKPLLLTLLGWGVSGGGRGVHKFLPEVNNQFKKKNNNIMLATKMFVKYSLRMQTWTVHLHKGDNRSYYLVDTPQKACPQGVHLFRPQAQSAHALRTSAFLLAGQVLSHLEVRPLENAFAEGVFVSRIN